MAVSAIACKNGVSSLIGVIHQKVWVLIERLVITFYHIAIQSVVSECHQKHLPKIP